MQETWFVRFTVKKNNHLVTIPLLISADNPNKAWSDLIEDQVKIHGVTRTDIDILVMNKVS